MQTRYPAPELKDLPDDIKAKVLAALMKRQAAVYDVSAPYAPTTSRG